MIIVIINEIRYKRTYIENSVLISSMDTSVMIGCISVALPQPPNPYQPNPNFHSVHN